MVVNSNAPTRVCRLADHFSAVKTGHEVPTLIRDAALRFLQIGVGSEISCMVNPSLCWVANTRTIWTHLVIKHADDFTKAAEELKLYREADASSEMTYKMWATIHAELAATMTRVAEEGAKLAKAAGVKAGSVRYLWADAIANQLYADYYEP